MVKKAVILLLDGLADRAFDALGGRTPLEAAATPRLDRLAAAGACGRYHAGLLGQALPSENAHFAMFGYSSAEFPGRGALEALGAGMALDPGDVAILAHFASLQKRGRYLVLVDGKPQADREQAKLLADLASPFKYGEVRLSFQLTHALSGILRLQGSVSPQITDTDPILAGRQIMTPLPFRRTLEPDHARLTAEALTVFLRRLHGCLNDHPLNRQRRKAGQPPINGMVTQRAGRLKRVPSFKERYGLKALIMASGIVYRGLGAYLGMTCRRTRDSGAPASDMARRIEAAARLLASYDLIHLHSKVPDEAGHRKQPALKKAAIEALDRGIDRAIDALLERPDTLLVITSDHATPSGGPLVHSGEPVPLLFVGPGVWRDGVRSFSETAMAAGSLGTVRGRELIHLILNYLDRAKLGGLMDTPDDQPFWPGRGVPFDVIGDPK